MPDAATPMTVDPPTFGEIGADQGENVGAGYVDEIRASQDEILEAHGRGDLKLYERLLRDDQVYPAFRQRRDAVVAREVKVDPGGDDPIDIAAADDIREQLKGLSFDRITYKMLTGIMYGRGVAECLYGIRHGRIVLADIKVRRSSRFAFTNGGELRLMRDSKPVALPPRKFWTYTTGADDDDDPNGRGLGYWLYWPVWFKRNAYKFWVTFLEVFAQGTIIGTVPSSWSKEKEEELLKKLGLIRAGGRLVVPTGVKAELFQAARDSGGDYNAFITLLNASITKIVLTQTMTTDDGSSLAQAKVHLQVADVGAKADSDLLTESFSNGPVRWLTEWNYPGAKAPLVYRDFTSAEDLSALATRDQTLSGIGYRPTPERILETYGPGYEPFTPVASAPMGGPSFAERRQLAAKLRRAARVADGRTARQLHRLADVAAFAEPRSASDAVEDLMAGDGWRRVLGPEVANLEELLESASSLEEVRDRLGDVALTDPNALTTALAQLMFAARVGGGAEYEPDDDGEEVSR